MRLYKLTDQDGYTRRGKSDETRWKEGFSLTKTPCVNPRLCSSDVIHAYTNINLAFLLNSQHSNIANPQLWECEGSVAVQDWGKAGCFFLKTIKKLENPTWIETCPFEVQIWFTILCAESVIKYYEDKYPNDDRPRQAIEIAKIYLKTKTTPNILPIADAARDASYAARADDPTYAVRTAARTAALVAYTVANADDAAYIARAASHVAGTASYAARAAEDAEPDFGELADKAVELAIKGEKV